MQTLNPLAQLKIVIKHLGRTQKVPIISIFILLSSIFCGYSVFHSSESLWKGVTEPSQDFHSSPNPALPLVVPPNVNLHCSRTKPQGGDLPAVQILLHPLSFSLQKVRLKRRERGCNLLGAFFTTIIKPVIRVTKNHPSVF